MDIVGPLLMAQAQKRFMLALTDYYSKWVMAESYAQIKEKDVRMFYVEADSWLVWNSKRDNR